MHRHLQIQVSVSTEGQAPAKYPRSPEQSLKSSFGIWLENQFCDSRKENRP